MSQLFISGGQITGASVSASVFPMNNQDLFPLGLTGLISLLSKGLSKYSPAPEFKSINSLALSLLYGPALTSLHDHWKNGSFPWLLGTHLNFPRARWHEGSPYVLEPVNSNSLIHRRLEKPSSATPLTQSPHTPYFLPPAPASCGSSSVQP